jgi:outer membrane protein assembly factor BamD (BamD/ComL family)
MVLEKYFDTPYAEPAQLRKAESLIERKKFDDAQKELNRYFTKYPSSPLKSDAEQLKIKLALRIQEEKDHPTKHDNRTLRREQLPDQSTTSTGTPSSTGNGSSWQGQK